MPIFYHKRLDKQMLLYELKYATNNRVGFCRCFVRGGVWRLTGFENFLDNHAVGVGGGGRATAAIYAHKCHAIRNRKRLVLGISQGNTHKVRKNTRRHV